jgi:hypothetical protein
MNILKIFQKNKLETRNDVIFWLKVNFPFILFWIIAQTLHLNARWMQVAWGSVWWMTIMNAVGLSVQLYEYLIRKLVLDVLRVKQYGKALFPMSLWGIVTWFSTFITLFVITASNEALMKGFWFVAPRIIAVVLVVWTVLRIVIIRK